MSKDRLPGDQIKVLLTAWMLRWFWKKFFINNEPRRYHTSFSVLWLLKCCQIFFVVFWFSIFIWGFDCYKIRQNPSELHQYSLFSVFDPSEQRSCFLCNKIVCCCNMLHVTSSSTLKRGNCLKHSGEQTWDNKGL